MGDIDKRLSGKVVDVLVGGPPCQAFSSVGRAQDKNSMRDDPRNYLFRCYLDILEKYKPKFFVFENVTGLLSARPDGHPIFPEIVECMSKHYDVCDDKQKIVLNAVHYGVPQVRKRVILIGVRRDVGLKSSDIYRRIQKTHFSTEEEKGGAVHGYKRYRTVKDAIRDLPFLKPGEGTEEAEYQTNLRGEYIDLMRKHCTNIINNHEPSRNSSLNFLSSIFAFAIALNKSSVGFSLLFFKINLP